MIRPFLPEWRMDGSKGIHHANIRAAAPSILAQFEIDSIEPRSKSPFWAPLESAIGEDLCRGNGMWPGYLRANDLRNMRAEIQPKSGTRHLPCIDRCKGAA